jgi:hypothetical protein
MTFAIYLVYSVPNILHVLLLFLLLICVPTVRRQPPPLYNSMPKRLEYAKSPPLTLVLQCVKLACIFYSAASNLAALLMSSLGSLLLSGVPQTIRNIHLHSNHNLCADVPFVLVTHCLLLPNFIYF